MTAAYAEAYGAWSRRAASDGNNRGSPVRDVALVLARQAFDARCEGRDLAQFPWRRCSACRATGYSWRRWF